MYVPQKNRCGFIIVSAETPKANKLPLCFLNTRYKIIPAAMVKTGIRYFIMSQFSAVTRQVPAIIQEINGALNTPLRGVSDNQLRALLRNSAPSDGGAPEIETFQ